MDLWGVSVSDRVAPRAPRIGARRREATGDLTSSTRDSIVLVAVLFLTGCTSPDGGGAVPLAGPDSLTQWAAVGGMRATGPLALGSIAAAAVLVEPTRFAVVDGQTQEVLLIAHDGQYLGAVGRKGAGPGEHRALRAIHGTPDGGFCTWDAQFSRVTRFGPDGGVRGSGRADLSSFDRIVPTFVGFFRDCSFVLRDGASAMDLQGQP